MGSRGATHYPYFASPFLALAHRGGITAAAPAEVENSVRSFVAAWEVGYTHLETDVHATSDGVLIAFHDDRLDRVTDAQGVIADLPWSAVSEARIGGQEPIPRLDELFETLPEARFNIDIKSTAATDALVHAVYQHGSEDRVCVGSFSTHSIRRFRKLCGGRVATSASPVEAAVFGAGQGIRRAWPLGGQAFQVPEKIPGTRVRLVTPGMIAAAHLRGAVVHVWTVNDPDAMERLIDLGVDGIVTDELGMLQDVLRERGLWEGNR
ncbi:MAG: glycerophosphodiester phosphodiesterase [Propioniciclava sp.]